MARPTGFNKGLRGKIGDRVTYDLNGAEITRRIGKLDKKVYQQAEAFAEMRKNNSEFGMASSVMRVLREALLPYKEQWYGPEFHSRLSGRLRTVAARGKGEKGKRGLEAAHLGLLHRLPLHKRRPKRAFFCTQDPLAIDRQGLKISLDKDMLELENLFGIKLREYHKIVIGGIVLSEVRYEDAYTLLSPEVHGLAAYATAENLPIEEPEALVRLEVKVDIGAEVPEGIGLVGVVGVGY